MGRHLVVENSSLKLLCDNLWDYSCIFCMSVVRFLCLYCICIIVYIWLLLKSLFKNWVCLHWCAGATVCIVLTLTWWKCTHVSKEQDFRSSVSLLLTFKHKSHLNQVMNQWVVYIQQTTQQRTRDIFYLETLCYKQPDTKTQNLFPFLQLNIWKMQTITQFDRDKTVLIYQQGDSPKSYKNLRKKFP